MITVVYFIYGISVLWAIVSILLYGNRPARSLAWLIIVIILPLLGVVFYLIFGINRKKFKFFTLNFNAKRKLYSFKGANEVTKSYFHKFENERYSGLNRLLQKNSGFHATIGNNIKLLQDGEITFEELFTALENARHFIHLQYYILEKGDLLDRLLKIFEQKLIEGVEIRILFDALGSFGWKSNQVKRLEKKGLKIFALLPLKINTILSTLNYRNHRKIAIIDGLLAFTGGVNISDKYIDHQNSEFGIWDDLHLKIEGPAVDHLHRVFIKDYYFASNEILLDDRKYLPDQKRKGDSVLQIVVGGPDLKYYSILHQYVMMIQCAKKSVCIENPYFIPNAILLEALKMANLRGVEVKIMVPKNNDSKLAKYSMFQTFESLLDSGVEIYVLRNQFSHSKLLIIDGEIASIGTGNFDRRSFEHNYEVNTLIYDPRIAQELVNDFESSLEDCKVLNYHSYKNRPLKQKLMEGVARIFAPLL